MSAKVRYWSFAGLLAAGVAAAVSVAVAQGPAPRPSDTPERGARRSMMMLDGRGSRLGVMVQDLDSADKASGVRIDSVDSGSAAEKAGIRAGDIVVEYDGERVRSTRQFTRLVQETADGRQVAMAVMRDGKGRRSLPRRRRPRRRGTCPSTATASAETSRGASRG